MSDHFSRSKGATLFRLASRNLRGGFTGFRIFISCIALGVAAITGIGSLAQSLSDGLATHGRRILGGDISISRMQRPASEQELAFFNQQGVVTHLLSLRAMVRTGDQAAGLAEIKAVDASYPAIGEVVLDPQVALPQALALSNGVYGAVADPALFARLNVKVGDRVQIGESWLELRAVLQTEPDKLAGGLSLGPRLLMRQEALQAVGLIRADALIRHSWRISLADRSDAALDLLGTQIPKLFPDAGFEIRNRRNAAPQFTRNLERFTQFLTLVGLTALIVGGIGVANATAAFVERRRESMAVMKAVGASGATVFSLALIEVMGMGLVGTLVGLTIGAALPFAIAAFAIQYLPVPLEPHVYPELAALGIVYGLLAVLAFSLWPLGRAHDVSVSALFRDEVAPAWHWPRRRYMAATLLAVLGLAAVAVLFAYDRKIALWSVVATTAIFVVLRGMGLALALLAKHLPLAKSTEWRLALANIHRPGSLAPTLVLSIGLGVTLLVTIASIDDTLRQQLRQSLPEKAPSFFFVDVPRDDLQPFGQFIAEQAPKGKMLTVPMMRGRITALNETRAENIKARDDIAWVLEGDRGITYSATPPEGSVVVEGEWWPKDYAGPPLLSFDSEAAKGLGLQLGDRITVNVLGRLIEAKIANFRRIEWQSLGINFVMVFSPNSFAGAPYNTLATLTNPPEASAVDEARLLAKVAARFPGITSVRVKDALEAIDELVGKLIAAIRGASLVTLFSAILVLAGALGAGQQARIYDAVILKTLGATRAMLIRAYVIEYAMIAVFSAIFGLIAGDILAQTIITKLMKLGYHGLTRQAYGVAILGVIGTIGLGLIGTWRVLGQKPARHLHSL